MLPRSIGARLALAYLVPTLLGLLALGYWVDGLARRALEEELGRKVVAVAAAAAATIPAERLPFLQPGDEGTRTYRNFRERLEQLQAATGVSRLALFAADERAIVDVGGAARIGDPLPELARDRLELAQVLAGAPQASQVLFEQGGRTYKTGYAPVKDGDRVVGAVLVEGSARYFEVLRDFRASLLVLGALAALGTLALAFVFSRAIAAPVERLAKVARRIGEGDLATPVALQRTDELGALARTLDEMRDRLLARDRQLQMMLAGIAHEVRNPLGGIELYSGLLLEELPADDPRALTVRKIRREIEYLARIVEDFLDYARERPLALEPTRTRPLLDEAVHLVEGDAARKEVRLQVAGEDLLLTCDPALLRRALLNLLRNAIDASPRGGPVSVSSRRSGERVIVEVADEGPGIPPDRAEQVFEPFFTSKEKGTGLGLAFVRRIAEAHGGSARVVPGASGCVVAIELPVAPRASPVAA